jgi:hypothetical protein
VEPAPRYNDALALPDIPATWKPSNISFAENREDLIAKAKRIPGFPTEDEAYNAPAEMAERERRRARIDLEALVGSGFSA